MAKARIVFHLPAAYLGDYAQAHHLGLFRRVAEIWGAKGVQIIVRDRRDGPWDQRVETRHYDDGDLHIVDMGRAWGPGVLNAAVAYIQPFWHLDAAGVQGESGIAGLPYEQGRIAYDKAAPFYEDLRRKIVVPRLSRRDQMERVSEFPAGSIAVFLQGTRPEAQG
ncbi:MAG: hypothetical protein ACRCS3_15130, partial [Paracoccaceae bacterium]